jgi:hypothetical protein
MDYLTVNIEKLLVWAVVFFTYLKANMNAWGVSSTWVSDVESKLADLQAAHTVWINPATKTKAAHTDMEAKRVIFAKAIGPLVQNLRSLPTLTAADYDYLEITPPNKGHHPKHPRPKTWIVLTVKVHGQGVVDFHYHDENTPSSTAKPADAHEAVIRISFADAEPASAEELTDDMVITVTRTPHQVVFPAEHIGKRLHASGAWVSPTGERGPWGPVVSTIIA